MRTIIFLFFSFSISAQSLSLRAQDDATGRRQPTLSIALPLVITDSTFNHLLKPFVKYEVEAPQMDIYYWFYPENLSWIRLTAPVTQGAAIPGSVKYVEIIDSKLDVATVKVNRQLNGADVTENRAVSEYVVRIHFTDASVLELKPCRIIANSDATATYPDIVPGSRWLFKSALDDGFIFGPLPFSNDGGLQIDYD